MMIRRMLQPHWHALLGIFLSATCAAAQKAPSTLPAPTENAGPQDVVAMRRGVEALLAIMGQAEAETGLLFPLVKQRKATGTKEVEYRYSKKMVPIYRYIRKPVEELVPVKTSSTVVMRRVVRSKVVKTIKIGEEERLVHDPKGDIVKTVTRPVYGPGGPDIQPAGWTGDNAMALYALLEAGVTPEEDVRVERLAWTINDYLRVYGVPDYTWDIAWSIAALARCPGDQFDGMIEDLLGRLASGQCATPKARGLWGPVCVNSDHVEKVIAEFAAVEKVGEKVRDLVRRAPDKEDLRLVKQQEELQIAREKVALLFRRVSNCAHRFIGATKPAVIQNATDFSDPGLEMPGWPYNLYHENMADLQSTALAVFAFRVAHDHGKLPKSFAFKRLRGLRKNALAKPIYVDRILRQTLTRLMAAQEADKGWDEMIVWEKTNRFTRIAERFKGVPGDIPRSVESRRMPICNAQATGAMGDLLAILGKTYQGRYASRLSAGRKLVGAGATFELPPKPPHTRTYDLKCYRIFDPVSGGVIEPYAMAQHLRLSPAGIQDDHAKLATYASMVEFLLANQGDDGLWPSRDNVLGTPSPALREFYLHRMPLRLKAQLEHMKALGVKSKQEYTSWHGFIWLAPARGRYWALQTDQPKWRATVHAVLTLSRANRTVVGAESE